MDLWSNFHAILPLYEIGLLTLEHGQNKILGNDLILDDMVANLVTDHSGHIEMWTKNNLTLKN